ncbi:MULTISPECIES: fluoride efflux transporter FluC [Nocardiaceae]|uniref:fluoride efflux transporter FluC n=1 Tax=Nocardiaceae TaxID=85025 RepID=UPI00039D2989|nr:MULTISPECIES: CrcB family protein [Rhodococcus]
MIPTRPAVSVTVAFGGAVGAVVRYEIWHWRDSPKWLLINTFGINVVGCLLLGATLGYLSGRNAPLARAAATGLACGFTTFSFYALQGITHDGAWKSVLYIVATPVAAVLALAAGALVTRPAPR